ncbi:hypothetical protein [Comamonas sp.]|uniref:hypothetical protein n=1 Tax=Comamonas sp. TaxID=34028 RepID=UPI002898F866|nr:hypothetical protein [Comamonas sp.]
MNMQALIDGISAQWMKERAETQMTLGDLISRLEALPPETVVGLGNPHSYRGYYSDLSFEKCSATVEDLLKDCKESMGKEFEGYKGGEFYMHAGVPVWVASEGCCGQKLIAINNDGSLELAEDD